MGALTLCPVEMGVRTAGTSPKIRFSGMMERKNPCFIPEQLKDGQNPRAVRAIQL